MTGHTWLDVVLGAAGAVVITWLLLVVALGLARPQGGLLAESLRLLPDLIRLLSRLAADRTQPPGVRLRLGLLLLYLAMPIDVVPDFIPVIGYADDAIVAAWALRSVSRRVGVDQLRRHWPGTDAGFEALCRLSGLTLAAPDAARTGD